MSLLAVGTLNLRSNNYLDENINSPSNTNYSSPENKLRVNCIRNRNLINFIVCVASLP